MEGGGTGQWSGGRQKCLSANSLTTIAVPKTARNGQMFGVVVAMIDVRDAGRRTLSHTRAWMWCTRDGGRGEPSVGEFRRGSGKIDFRFGFDDEEGV